MQQQFCENCNRPLHLKVVCNWCGAECEGMKSEVLVMIVGGIFCAGILFGSLISFFYVK